MAPYQQRRTDTPSVCTPKLPAFGVALLLAALCTFAQEPATEQIHEAGEPGLIVPVLIPESRTEPVYPERARADGVKGTVFLRLMVSTQGLVRDAQVFRAPYNGHELAVAALDVVRTWRYQPATVDGVPVVCRIMASVSFHPGVSGSQAVPVVAKDPVPEKAVPAAGAAAATASPEPEPATVAPQAERSADDGPFPEDKTGGAEATTVPAEPVGVDPLRAPSDDEQADPAPAEESRPAAVEQAEPAPPDTILLPHGGPGDLVLGTSGANASSLLAGATWIPVDGRGVRLSDPGRGMEVELQPTGSGGNREVVGIRYVFQERDGLSPCPYRTRLGLGKGTLCLGVIPAYGQPDAREVHADLTTLRYFRDGTQVDFICDAGRLVELLVSFDKNP